jgi:hypothetical protein
LGRLRVGIDTDGTFTDLLLTTTPAGSGSLANEASSARKLTCGPPFSSPDGTYRYSVTVNGYDELTVDSAGR